MKNFENKNSVFKTYNVYDKTNLSPKNSENIICINDNEDNENNNINNNNNNSNKDNINDNDTNYNNFNNNNNRPNNRTNITCKDQFYNWKLGTINIRTGSEKSQGGKIYAVAKELE